MKFPTVPAHLRSFVSTNSLQKTKIKSLKIESGIEVFWKQDLRWNLGKVQNVSGNTVSIKYDDGDEETIEDISRHVWRLIQEQNPDPPPSFTVPSGIRNNFEIASAAKGKDIIVSVEYIP